MHTYTPTRHLLAHIHPLTAYTHIQYSHHEINSDLQTRLLDKFKDPKLFQTSGTLYKLYTLICNPKPDPIIQTPDPQINSDCRPKPKPISDPRLDP